MIEVLLALLGGACLTVQVGINSSLRSVFGSPIWAAFISFFIGTCALGIAGALTRSPLPQKFDAPLWMWLGGILGASYLFLSVFLAARLSATTFFGCVVAGQMLASLVIDHFGWLGFERHPLSPTRIGGALLLGVAVWLLQMKR